MCSIFCIFNCSKPLPSLREKAIQLSAKMHHRGPDWSGVYENSNAIMVHERLSIVDIEHGVQPLYGNCSDDSNFKNILAVNGEIYNHQELKNLLKEPYSFSTNSDCEIILALYKQHNKDADLFLNKLKGMFAFALHDEQSNSVLIARDPLGIIPLYIGYDSAGNIYVSSELKSLSTIVTHFEIFPPGHYLICDSKNPQQEEISTFNYIKYYQKKWVDYSVFDVSSNIPIINNEEKAIKAIRSTLINSVKSHLMTDVPYGVLLSGGLDSSIIAAITKQFIHRRIEDGDKSKAWWPQMHTFAVGLEGSPDLAAAQKAADHLESVHHSITYTIQEGLDAVSKVIHSLETYDTTTIRSSVPMFLMARKIRSMGIKMVLSGEGSDELFGGYLYFHKAPSAKEFHKETVRKLEKLHLYDCLRANKAMMAWSIEARVPFLDREFIDTAMLIDPVLKMVNETKMEKYLLRKAFADYLPESIAWRQKEQFSDGVGYGWIDQIQAHVENIVSDHMFAKVDHRFPINTPATKEAYWYRDLFEHYFPDKSAIKTVENAKSVACSTPEALEWDQTLKHCIDPSGRSIGKVHNNAYLK